MKEFNYGIDHLTVDLAISLVKGELKGVLTDEVRSRVKKSHDTVQQMASGEKLIYSVNTGFGSLCTTRISKNETGKLQENLLKSHSVGVGNPVDVKIAKLMLILKLQALCMGYSGISEQVIDRIFWHVTKNIIPKVPEKGSVGASGDLAPLAHLFLPLIGLGFLTEDGINYKPSVDVLDKFNLKTLTLKAKEGLALINGTQFIASHAVFVAEIFFNCLEHADLIGAMTLEGYLASPQPFKEQIINLRPHPGAKLVAKRISKCLENSQFVESHINCERVQDPYSIRCMPQVHGASRDAYAHLIEVLERELNSVTDNPIVFDNQTAISGGNFHGQPLALPLDYINLAASELGNISDRRTYLLLEGKWGLPPYLIKESGLNSGFMIAQYCSAALVSENKSMCFPASADSIPTSMGQEDHVSMGSISARKALQAVMNLEIILGIELLCSTQAFDFRRPLKSGKILESIHKYVRERIPHVSDDVILSQYIDKCVEIIRSKKLVEFYYKPE